MGKAHGELQPGGSAPDPSRRWQGWGPGTTDWGAGAFPRGLHATCGDIGKCPAGWETSQPGRGHGPQAAQGCCVSTPSRSDAGAGPVGAWGHQQSLAGCPTVGLSGARRGAEQGGGCTGDVGEELRTPGRFFPTHTHESAFPKGNTHPKKQKCGSLTASDGNSALWGTFLWGTVLLGRVVGMRKAVHLQGILPGILPPTDLQIT